jgi:hypothetical protein
MRPEEDPGWGPALKSAGFAFVPFTGPVMARRRNEAQGGLLTDRTIFVIQNSLWLIVVGAAFTLAALWIVAPSRTNIARQQQWLRDQGSPLDLTRALNTVQPRGSRADTPE